MAVILDGNRRWATRRGLPAAAGYRRGGDRVVEVLPECERAGVEVVTLWSLSTDNLHRRGDELEPLIDVIAEVFARLSDQRRWRLRLIGNTEMLPGRLRTDITRLLTRTRDATGMTVNIAVAYNGRDEIARAVTALVAEHSAAGTLDRLAHGVAPADSPATRTPPGNPTSIC